MCKYVKLSRYLQILESLLSRLTFCVLAHFLRSSFELERTRIILVNVVFLCLLAIRPSLFPNIASSMSIFPKGSALLYILLLELQPGTAHLKRFQSCIRRKKGKLIVPAILVTDAGSLFCLCITRISISWFMKYCDLTSTAAICSVIIQ